MLKDLTLFGEIDLVKKTIARLKNFEPPEGYYLAFSGGKDSVVIKELANMSGVKYDAHYNLTTIDPPELIYFIREHYKDVAVDKPEMPFLVRLANRGFPLRQARWCCEEYKERGGEGRLVITGVRWAESAFRAKRRMVEHCIKSKTKRFLHVILDWTDSDVWEFIKTYKIPYCKLYDEGWTRIGCLFCPNAGKRRLKELERYPRYAETFRVYFRRLYARHNDRPSMKQWKSGDEMFDWWIRDQKIKGNPDQGVLFE